MNNFTVGDVVQLASGGPDMTVTLLEHRDYPNRPLQCTWWCGDHFAFEQFNPETLIMISPAASKKTQ